MFPSGLPRRCILAGTSEKGVCSQCGAQWERQVETVKGQPASFKGSRFEDGKNGRVYGNVSHGERVVESRTSGWAAACAHGLGPVPATVLDPFAGTATTLATARQLGRMAVGIELSPDYCNIARKRIAEVPLPMVMG